MAINSGSVQSAQALLVSLLYAKICHELERQTFGIGPGGLADASSPSNPQNEVERIQKIQNGPGGLCDSTAPNDSSDQTVELIAAAMVEEEVFRQNAQAAFDEGQRKEEGKFAA